MRALCSRRTETASLRDMPMPFATVVEDVVVVVINQSTITILINQHYGTNSIIQNVASYSAC